MKTRTALIATCLLFFGNVCFGQSDIPVLNFPEGTPTSVDTKRERLAFDMRELALYEKHTKDPPRAKKLAIEFLRCSISSYTGQYESIVPHVRTKDELSELGKAAIDAGSKDPMVFRHYSKIFAGHGGDGKLCKLYADRALELFDQSDYPRATRFQYLAAVNSANVRRGKEYRDKLADEIFMARRDWFKYAVQEPSDERSALAVYRSAVDRAKGEGFFRPESSRLGIKQMEELQEAHPWLYEMCYGDHCLTFAFSESRTEWARKLAEEEDRNVREEFLARAADYYERAYKLYQDRPEAAAGMMEVIVQRRRRDKAVWDWLQKAINAEVDHELTYRHAMGYLSSPWTHNKDDVREFADQCGGSARFDTIIPRFYLECLDYIRFDAKEFDEEVYDKIKFVREGLLDHPIRARADGGLSSGQIEDLTYMLLLAHRNDRYADALDYFERLGPIVDTHNWGRTVDIADIRSECHCRVDFATEIIDAERLMTADSDESELKQGIELVRSLSSKSAERHKLHLPKLVERAEMYGKYYLGEWVDFRFDKHFLMWNVRGDWQIENESTLFVSNKKDRYALYMMCRMKFPGPKELQVDIGTVDGTDFYPSILIGRRMDGGVHYGLAPGNTSVHRNWTTEEGSRTTFANVPAMTPLAKADFHTLTFRAFSTTYTEYYADGKGVAIATEPDLKTIENYGIYSPTWLHGQGEFRIRNFRIRRITVDPPTDADDLEFYETGLEREPENSLYLWAKGRILLQRDEIDEAVSCLEKPESLGCREAGFDLARAYKIKGRYLDALYRFSNIEKSTSFDLGHELAVPVRWALSEILASCPVKRLRNGKRATALAEEVVKHDQSAESYEHLAAAYAATYQFERAIQALDKADELDAGSENRTALRQSVEQKKPYRFESVDDVDSEWIGTKPAGPLRNEKDLVEISREALVMPAYGWSRHEFHLDQFLNSDQSHTYTVHSEEEESPAVVIDLGKVQEVRVVRVVNRKEESAHERAKSLSIWTSSDLKSWQQRWSASEARADWRVEFPSETEVRYIKIGLQGNGMLQLHKAVVFGPKE